MADGNRKNERTWLVQWPHKGQTVKRGKGTSSVNPFPRRLRSGVAFRATAKLPEETLLVVSVAARGKGQTIPVESWNTPLPGSQGSMRKSRMKAELELEGGSVHANSWASFYSNAVLLVCCLKMSIRI
ncbi:hypothetical protein CEXT_703041 [Caerostris extrusa]|uniref:Uncharacterized protein n=1 Tax=Caerostris extrusa TaxID=172846 RepID=A0AAV4XVJ3_CAEEX|nr:hypothetical protein CEXT_703041 [Caerostris extrusa]